VDLEIIFMKVSERFDSHDRLKESNNR